jgi:hypothetical protein
MSSKENAKVSKKHTCAARNDDEEQHGRYFTSTLLSQNSLCQEFLSTRSKTINGKLTDGRQKDSKALAEASKNVRLSWNSHLSRPLPVAQEIRRRDSANEALMEAPIYFEGCDKVAYRL